MGIKLHNAGLIPDEDHDLPGPRYDLELWGRLSRDDIRIVLSKNISILQTARSELLQSGQDGALSVLIVEGQIDLLHTLQIEINREIQLKQDSELFGEFDKF